MHLKLSQFLISLDKRQFYHLTNYNLLLLNTIFFSVHIIIVYLLFEKSLKVLLYIYLAGNTSRTHLLMVLSRGSFYDSFTL